MRKVILQSRPQSEARVNGKDSSVGSRPRVRDLIKNSLSPLLGGEKPEEQAFEPVIRWEPKPPTGAPDQDSRFEAKTRPKFESDAQPVPGRTRGETQQQPIRKYEVAPWAQVEEPAKGSEDAPRSQSKPVIEVTAEGPEVAGSASGSATRTAPAFMQAEPPSRATHLKETVGPAAAAAAMVFGAAFGPSAVIPDAAPAAPEVSFGVGKETRDVLPFNGGKVVLDGKGSSSEQKVMFRSLQAMLDRHDRLDRQGSNASIQEQMERAFLEKNIEALLGAAKKAAPPPAPEEVSVIDQVWLDSLNPSLSIGGPIEADVPERSIIGGAELQAMLDDLASKGVSVSDLEGVFLARGGKAVPADPLELAKDLVRFSRGNQVVRDLPLEGGKLKLNDKQLGALRVFEQLEPAQRAELRNLVKYEAPKEGPGKVLEERGNHYVNVPFLDAVAKEFATVNMDTSKYAKADAATLGEAVPELHTAKGDQKKAAEAQKAAEAKRAADERKAAEAAEAERKAEAARAAAAAAEVVAPPPPAPAPAPAPAHGDVHAAPVAPGPVSPAPRVPDMDGVQGLSNASLFHLDIARQHGLSLMNGTSIHSVADHATGNAIDVTNVTPGTPGGTPEMAAYAETMRAKGRAGEGVRYIAYAGMETSAASNWEWTPLHIPPGGWGSGMPATDRHDDHVHVAGA